MTVSGSAAEDAAAVYLTAQGLQLLERNYRCRFGEIDLILREGRTLVFVEVRYRRNRDFGGAAESITAAKRERLLKAARHYMSSHKQFPECRFDAVLMHGEPQKIEWLVNAFGE